MGTFVYLKVSAINSPLLWHVKSLLYGGKAVLYTIGRSDELCLLGYNTV
jgi:hypothetical protein